MSVRTPTLRTFDDPILKMVCEAVSPGEPIGAVLDEMRRQCIKSKIGVGLAAPQVGIAKRIILTMLPRTKTAWDDRVQDTHIFINPVIIGTSKGTNLYREACLSFPGISKIIRRHNSITLQYEDERRSLMVREFHGFHARVVQHECDHLDGICKVGDPSYKADL